MVRLPLGLMAMPLACLLLSGCGAGGADEPTPGTTPSSEPTSVPTETRETPKPTPIPTPATPEPVPTVHLPEVRTLEYLRVDLPVPPLPAEFAPPEEDPALATLISTALSGFEGEYSVVVRNLEDGRSASINQGKVYYAASLFKLALLLEAYRQRDAGEVDFAELLTLDKEYVDYDFGTLKYLELEEGDMLTVADALKAMIIVSDTPTAVMIQDVVNPVRVEQTLRSLGINDMSVLTSELPTTASDMALLMVAVAAGAEVTAESRSEMLALLLQESIRGGIPSGVPENVAVAHKTGNFTNATHDVALVWGPAGPYVIAVLSDRAWESQPIVAVSKAVWDYFTANP